MPLPRKIDVFQMFQSAPPGYAGFWYSSQRPAKNGEPDTNYQFQEAINSLIDEVTALRSTGPLSSGGADANIMLEIIKENNKQWMELLKFMKDMKLEALKQL